MMRVRFLIFCVITLLTGGCASVSYAPVAYRQNGVDLGASPRLKLLRTANDPVLQKVSENLAADLQKSNRVTVTQDNADYWVWISYTGNFRTDDQAALVYNQKIAKVSNRVGAAGADVLTTTQNWSSAYGGSLNVTVYSVRNLELVYCLDFAYLDSDFGPAAARDRNAYLDRAASELAGCLDALFLTTTQKSDTAIVADADNELKNNLRNNRPDLAQARGKAILPQRFDAFASALSGGAKPEHMETTLGNYYLLLVAEEAQTADPAEWKQLYLQQQQILQLSSSDALAAASANALGRLEGKLYNGGKL